MIQNEEMITIGIVGEAEVGKTMFINKFIKRASPAFIQNYTPTIAIQIAYGVYQSQEGTKVRIKTWDTSGENKYKEIVAYHLKDVDIVIIMYDITDYLSFQRINEWVKRLKKENVWPQSRLLVGNKVDLIEMDHHLRKVKQEEGERVAKQLKAKFCEISVKSDAEVADFNDMIQNILNLRVETQIKNRQKYLTSYQQKNEREPVCQCSIF